jgi:hypothetical protein
MTLHKNMDVFWSVEYQPKALLALLEGGCLAVDTASVLLSTV